MIATKHMNITIFILGSVGLVFAGARRGGRRIKGQLRHGMARLTNWARNFTAAAGYDSLFHTLPSQVTNYSKKRKRHREHICMINLLIFGK